MTNQEIDARIRRLKAERMALQTALGAIQQLLDAEQWSPDTLDDIAEILEQVGFEVRDAN